MSRIVVCCPAYVASGGPELLHQVCFKLRKIGYNAVMGYYGVNHNVTDDVIHTAYREYNNPYIYIYIDSMKQ